MPNNTRQVKPKKTTTANNNNEIKYLTIDEIQELLFSGDNHKTKSLEETAKERSRKLKDGFSNSVMNLGESNKLAEFDEYEFETDTLNWWLWLALYNESWVFKRVVDKPATDMVRSGISINGRADFELVYKNLENLRSDFIKLIKWGRLFGGSVMVLLFNKVSFEDMEKPMKESINKVKESSVLKSYVTDRWFGCAPSYDDTVSNLANIDFGTPKYYTITFADGASHTIHHSWVLRYEGRTAPNFVKTGYLSGWGYCEGSHIMRELERDDKLKATIQSLVDKSLIEVFKMKGLKGIYMGLDARQREQIDKRLRTIQYARNNNSLTFIDADDSYEEHGFSGLAGIADILQQNMWQIAAAVEMQGVLFGDLSNGFSTDSDSLERYDETIQNLCEDQLRLPYTKILKILYKKYDIKEEVSFTFNSIIPEKRNQTKLQDIQSILDICSKMISDKALDPVQESQILSNYLRTGQINFYFDKKNENNLTNETAKKLETNQLGGDDEDEVSGDFGGFNNMQLKEKGNIEQRENKRQARQPEQQEKQETQEVETTEETTE